MKLFVDGNKSKVVIAHKTPRPRMSWTQGRGWDQQYKTIDGREIAFHFEVGRGRRMYFQIEDHWYVAHMWQDYDPFDFAVFTTTANAVSRVRYTTQ
jgi:hypothetical protein